MCGIAGVFHYAKERKVDTNLLEQMTNVLSHRGPDGEGFYIDGNVGLGHRRLKIIDLETGDQPMLSEDRGIAIVYNGEIYNYIELREELINFGYKFRTDSDTEVLIKSYQHWGTNCLNKFNGMFAFALWDNKENHLFLARDRIGEKPLNYAIYDNSFLFASELKSFFSYGIPKEIRYELMEIYLVLTNIPAPHSFYKNIFKLMPGHFIIVNQDGFKEYKYWDLPAINEENVINDKKNVYEEFAHLLEDSIKIRMRSDVPYGAFLSGGLDSSSVVSLMSKISSHPINTFTIGFSEKEFDESHLAAKVAEKFLTTHHLGTVNPSNIFDSLKICFDSFDEPFGDSSAIPTYQVSQYASEHVKMVLTGDGGDEVLSGYSSYLGIKISNIVAQMPNILVTPILKFANAVSKNQNGSIRYKFNRFSQFLSYSKLSFRDRLIMKQSFTELSLIKDLTYNLDTIRIEDYIADSFGYTNGLHDFYKLMYFDFKHSLPNDYLVKVDRMSMANSLETRTPFLDYRLIELMTKVNKDIKLPGYERKSILKKTIGQNLPKELIKAKKRGFQVPVRDWFRNEEYKKKIELEIYQLNNLFDNECLFKIIDDNYKGIHDNGNFIWTLLQLASIFGKK